MLPYDERLKQFAKNLRNNPSEAEKKLWGRLRNRQMKGAHFYRQKPLGEYIADFYCPKARLVIELDGSQHGTPENAERDARRSAALEKRGLKVLRFSNGDVLRNMDGVLMKIREMV